MCSGSSPTASSVTYMAVEGAAPVPYRARATRDGTVIAESDAAVRVDVPDGPPLLWFPRDDVVEGALHGLDRRAWREGEGDLGGHVAFDFEAVHLALVDARPGDDERDVTVKRFPTWGDAADLIEIMDVRPDGQDRYLSPARANWRRPVVEGSQMLGQAIVAAGRHSPGRRPVSASMVFTRAADARAPYAIELDPVAGGRTFDALGVRVRQGERTCAAGTLLLDVTAPDVMRHADPMPDVPGPYESTPHDMSVTGRDLRIVDDTYTGDPDAPVGPPEIDTWVRFRSVPDDQPIHAGLLAQFSGHIPIAAGLRPHAGLGQDQAHVTLSTAINAISLSIHADIRADRWMLYHHRSTFAGDGMTHAECRVHDEEGSLVASFTVDAMVRAFADPSKSDARTGL
jgi:acyl-CoA thioesterase II